jgi:hypothetical protein
MQRIATVLLSLVLATEAQAQTLKELSEKCGKQAEEAFEKRLKSEVSEEGHQITWGENHYNSRLRKCFVLEAREDVERGVRERKQLKLIDLQGNREIGVYVFVYRQTTTTDCSVQGKQCNNEEEFRALIKPFMED